jgi:hypothetical protein
MATRKETAPVDVDATVERISRDVSERGACTRAACKVPKAAWPQVEEKLAQRGWEVTAKTVRRRLREQLLGLLESGALLPMAGASLARQLSGTSGPEAARTALALVQSKEAHVVMRARGLFLVHQSVTTVTPSTLAPSIKSLDAAIKLAKKAISKKASLLPEDFAGLLAPAWEAAKATKETEARTPLTVVEIARGLLDPSMGLAFVPAIVRALAAGSSVSAAHAALTEAARRGQIELRPESGLGRLDQEERALCIPAIDGTPLSWLRIREGSTE